MKRVIVVGGGFAGINVAKSLGKVPNLEVIIIDKNNYHVFQPLLYQVAMAGLNPSDIAVSLRSLFSGSNNTTIYMGTVTKIDPHNNQIETDFSSLSYDYLVLACGAIESFFGHNEWKNYSFPLKTIEHAREIRRRVLTAFEKAEKTDDIEKQAKHLTFVIVGGGPTGVELAGSIGEMSKYTLAKDFKNVNTKLTKIFLVEAGDRILPTFDKKSSAKASTYLRKLGVRIYTSSKVTNIIKDSIEIEGEKIDSATVIWAAGVKASTFDEKYFNMDNTGRIFVEDDLSIKDFPNIFVAGDMAHFTQNSKPLQGIAPVAIQQGRFTARNILNEFNGKKRKNFKYIDKGQMVIIGRNKALAETGKLKFSGFFAWFVWLFIHIYYLVGFKNRTFVLLQWIWSYITYKKGSRLILP